MNHRAMEWMNLGGMMVAVMSAATVAVLLVQHEMREGASFKPPPKIVLAPGAWDSLRSRGHRIGDDGGIVTIVEFADFQCPACREFIEGPLRAIRAQYPGAVTVVFRHWPLKYHGQAMPAALASECAGAQGRFEQFHDLLFGHQDSLGMIPMVEFARRAGVGDLRRFRACVVSPGTKAAVAEDVAAAKAIHATGTPTVIVNARQFVGYPDSASLVEAIVNARKLAVPQQR